MRDKKYNVSIIVAEQIENEAMDSLFVKKTYEMCLGKEDVLNTLKRHYNDVKMFVENKLKKNEGYKDVT